MKIIIILVTLSFIIAFGFLIAFIWSVKSGQYDDIESPSHRIFFDQTETKN
ncbi:MAG: cbb3-type cytochrome oxidase assembly protein CcoS [Saprospiraceae bacterium]|nr:cbb3-type cytochrome oxidase assembly protein CcoS [Saprospiraceae bacterium]